MVGFSAFYFWGFGLHYWFETKKVKRFLHVWHLFIATKRGHRSRRQRHVSASFLSITQNIVFMQNHINKFNPFHASEKLVNNILFKFINFTEIICVIKYSFEKRKILGEYCWVDVMSK